MILLASTLPMAYTARELKLLALNKEAEVARAGYERELELAARIQSDLFPGSLPALDGYDLAARNRPAKHCGGDYYDAIVTANEQTTLFCVADVSGKGLPASLLMSHMQATLRALLGRTDSLQSLAGFANTLLHGSTAANKYVTAAMLELHASTGEATCVSAGHINSLHFTAGGDVARLDSTGPPLGLMPVDGPYDARTLIINRGDCIVLCSDGVIDAQNEAGDEFGEERLAAIVSSHRDAPAAQIVDRTITAIDQFAGAAPQFDDITIMIIKRQG